MTEDAKSSNIFTDPAGRPIRIFVETSEFAFRPKLVRELRRCGAAIAHYPTDAQIILVDLETGAGMQFVKDWSAEPGKVVLQWQWASSSIEAGRVLLAGDSWGGFRQPPVTNDGSDTLVDNEHPLPTPRHTPPNADSSSQLAANLSIGPTLHALQGQDIPSSSTALASTVLSELLPVGVLFPGQQSQPSITSPPSQGLVSPGQIQPELFAAVAQFLSAANVDDIQRALAQAQASNMTDAGFSSPLAASDGPQKSTSTGLAALDFTSTTAGAAIVQAVSPPFLPSPDSSNSSTALKRKRSETEDCSSHKGKERASSLEFKQRFSDDEDSYFSTSQSGYQGSRREHDEVFTTDHGEPVTFWVQMETRQRGDLLQLIKRNKGKIVAEILDADIAVLALRSKPFDHWLKLATHGNKVVVQPRYIQACIKESALLELDGFGYDGHIQRPRRGRPPGSSKVLTPAKLKEPKKADTPLGRKPSSKARQKEETAKTVAQSLKPGHSSDSPSPPEVPTRSFNGKYLYTAEEVEYFHRYIPVLLSRDPNMSVTAMGDKLHEKMPHHTLISWRSWLSGGFRPEYIDQCRKKAFIAYRKVENQKSGPPGQPPSSTAALSEAPSGDAPPPELPPAANENTIQTASNDVRDFEFITQFLADGGADQRTDDEVWGSLAKEHPTRTADQWQAFWAERGEEINAEVQRRQG